MSLQQRILNGCAKANSARVMLQGRPSEAQAKQARNLLKQARQELLEAVNLANMAVSEARARDSFDRSERAKTADSWLRLAGEVAGC